MGMRDIEINRMRNKPFIVPGTILVKMYTISKKKKENNNFVYVWMHLDGCMYSYAYTPTRVCVCTSKDN